MGQAMSERLTKARRETLQHCPDWSAPHEVTWRRHKATGEIISLTGTEISLGWLRERGLVEFEALSGAYRQTAAGRAALEASQP
jgi:hypothetical protein